MRPQNLLRRNSLRFVFALSLLLGTDAFALNFMNAIANSKPRITPNELLKNAMFNGTSIANDSLKTAQGFVVLIESRGKYSSPGSEPDRCLGAAVTQDVVITAGHCVVGRAEVTVKFIRKIAPLEFEVVKAKAWKAHPDYNGGYEGRQYAKLDFYNAGRFHDIGVILLKTASRIAVPITAVSRDFDPVYERRNYFSFGHKRNNLYVREDEIQFSSFEEVNYRDTATHWFETILKDVLICHGDSGGPITVSMDDEFIPNRVIHYLVGVTVTTSSYKKPTQLEKAIQLWGSEKDIPLCGSGLLFVDIAHHVDWINETLAQMDPKKHREIPIRGE